MAAAPGYQPKVEREDLSGDSLTEVAMEFEFHPRMLISGPYRDCPNCGKHELGVLQVGRDSCTLRCRECLHKQLLPLCPLNKKVLYVDQFAISNMMKAINDEVDGHEATVADPFWLTLFNALERVCKLQLAVCPESDAHRQESMVSPFFEALKRMYEQLAHGVSFEFLNVIAQEQLLVAITAWVRGEAPVYDFSPQRALRGQLNEWPDRFIISVDMNYPPSMVEGFRKSRIEVHESLVDLYREFQAVKNTKFDYWIAREEQGYKRGILESARLYRQNLQDTLDGKVDFTALDSIYTSNGLDQLQLILRVLRESGTSEELLGTRLDEFFESADFKLSPANRLSSLMWAVIGQRAAAGQKKPPNQGMANDITVVSTLLPYCDAMLVDNGCRALLENIPKRYAQAYPTRVFSKSNGEKFLAYLRQLELDADPMVLSCVRQVYGDDWPRPYAEMYKDERRRQHGV